MPTHRLKSGDRLQDIAETVRSEYRQRRCTALDINKTESKISFSSRTPDDRIIIIHSADTPPAEIVNFVITVAGSDFGTAGSIRSLLSLSDRLTLGRQTE